jgi:hypothetical protein
METLLVIAIMIVIGLIVGIIGYYSHKQEQKRTADISGLAAGFGLNFSPTGDFPLQDRLSILPLLKQGRDRRLSNLLSGETDEVRISIFDYRYTTGSGKQSSTTRLTIAALESPKLKIPAFTLRPENFFDKIGGLLGLQDLDFADHPEFSGNFVLKGAEEELIRQLFNRQMRDFFVARTGCCVEAFPGMMIYYLPGKRRPPAEFAKLLEEAYLVYGVIVDR